MAALRLAFIPKICQGKRSVAENSRNENPSFLLSWSDVYMCVFMHTCVYVYVCMCVHEGVSEKLLLGRKLHSMSM